MSHIDPGPAVVLGMGQLGTTLATGLRRQGCDVVEIRRGEESRMSALAEAAVVLVCVAEEDLAAAVAAIPPPLRSRVGLVQNELVPATWRALGLDTPTVAVVWFEKKAGRDAIPLLATPVAGPARELVAASIVAVGLPARLVEAGAELTAELVAKNLYILVANLGGLAGSLHGEAPAGVRWPSGVATMGALLGEHRAFARALGREILAVERARMGEVDGGLVDEAAAWTIVHAATDADPAHGCRGRSAPVRLARTLERARRHGVDAPLLGAIAAAQLPR